MSDDEDQSSFSLVSSLSVEVADEASNADADQETDEFEIVDNDDDSEWDDHSSDSVSVCTIAHVHEFDHGRQYHGYKSGRYPLPNDVAEQRREDTTHTLMLELTNQRLFFSNIGDSPVRILDVGTGTGTWAIDVADQYPCSKVVGIDLSPIQPERLPPNLRMFVEDCEEPGWKHDMELDLVHFREMVDFIRGLGVLLANVYTQLKNGGWVEFQDFGHDIFCEDDTLPEDDALQRFNDLSAEGMKKFGCTGFGRRDIQQCLRDAGFQNVQVVAKKVPIGPWHSEREMQLIGLLMRDNVYESLDAYASKPFAALGMSRSERAQCIQRVRKSLKDHSVRRYVNCYFCFGQKVEATSSSEE